MAQRAPGQTALWPLLAFLGFTALVLLVYRPALQGPFISDDVGYIGANPYTASLSLENVVTILDPRGDARMFTANYAPVHLLLHALERQIFADAVLGYHLVNVFVHAANATLLAALLAGSGLPLGWALAGAVLFAVHPANVEAVAWISQLKTSGALALSLGALLAWPRRAGLATGLFALALLTKASAAFALPMAAALTWARGGDRRQWLWLGAWAALLVLYAIPQTAAIGTAGGARVPAFADPAVHARTVVAVGARYLLMAVTSLGVSAFQEPAPARSWLDPWWLAGLVCGGLLAWRALACLRRRELEAAWWIAAAASFVPISQIFPFPIPVADRYLYFILPGLLGGALLALRARPLPLAAARVLAASAVGLCLLFAFHASARARLWRSEQFLYLDAARHYPDGATAHYLRARRAARAGDLATVVAGLRSAAERGLDTYEAVLADPAFASVRGEPEFLAAVREMAGRWLAAARQWEDPTQAQLRAVARAHLVRDEIDEAEAALERALAAGGPQQERVRRELAALRQRKGGGSHRDRRP
jgi:hypothetical protein